VRDAILFSRWIWETFNAPERFALALAHIGARVVYRENPVSGLLRTGSKLREVAGAGNSTGCISLVLRSRHCGIWSGSSLRPSASRTRTSIFAMAV